MADDDYSAWESLKWILSDTLIYWALKLLPDRAPEKRELSKFIVEYMRRSMQRWESRTRKIK